ncbi:MAG: tRNA (adenine-N1)-methyltransferase [Chloroflexi bacterium]|nr:tRNA (adenine-N1)-methyltransferase [Chloroflexota bacterium]
MTREPQDIWVAPRRPFAEGDHALLIDRRGRRYYLSLSLEKTFHTHLGTIPHSQIIGQEPGARIYTATGHQLLALSPTLGDFVLEMPHSTQVIYPKDLGIILMYGDVFPGATVLEAGLGSGALTLALLRAVGEKGRVTSYEVRPELVKKALANIEAMLPNATNHEVKVGDIYQGIEERDLDRVVLDVPEPWQVVPHAGDALVGGGIFVSFLPTVLQVYQLHEALRETPYFEMLETVEVLVRPWSVSSRSIRPAHRMVGHTGFITTARRCAPRRGPEVGGNVPKGAPSGEDVA